MARTSHMAFAVALLFSATAAQAADKPAVGLWVAGVRADQLHSSLYAGLVNGTRMEESEAVAALLDDVLASDAGQSADGVAWDDATLAQVSKAARSLGLDALVLARSVQRGAKRILVSVVAVGPRQAQPLFTDVWTIVGRGNRPGFERYNFGRVRETVFERISSMSSVGHAVAQR